MSNNMSVFALSKAVSTFFPKLQLKVVMNEIYDCDQEPDNLEEFAGKNQYFIEILQKFKNTFEVIPKTYETRQTRVDETIAYLHYFVGGADWWIIEKDQEEEQRQAFGVTKLAGQKPYLGYISITELINLCVKSQVGIPLFVELDFHWQPTKLKDIPALSEMFTK